MATYWFQSHFQAQWRCLFYFIKSCIAPFIMGFCCISFLHFVTVKELGASKKETSKSLRILKPIYKQIPSPTTPSQRISTRLSITAKLDFWDQKTHILLLLTQNIKSTKSVSETNFKDQYPGGKFFKQCPKTSIIMLYDQTMKQKKRPGN